LATGFWRFVAAQLRRPSGLTGGWLLPRLWNRRNRALNDAAFAALAPCAGDRVLEIGFGGGYLLARIAGAVGDGRLAGVDASAAIVNHCRRRFRALVRGGTMSLECADVAALPFPPASFDKVCAVNTIFYWDDAPQAFAEIARVMAAGGALILVFTDKAALDHRPFAGPGVATYAIDEVRQMLGRAGFGDVAAAPQEDRYRRFWRVVARRPG
jgi:ubiquinone/menaquinone biosynthesis C-methylase UbiE